MTPYTAFLRVRHPSIDPALVTTTLGLTPIHAWAAGSVREAVGAEGARGRHSDSYWLAPLGDAAWQPARSPAAVTAAAIGKGVWPLTRALPLEAFLLGQLRLLMPNKAFFARLKDEGAACELAVTLSPDERWNVDLPPALLRSLADLNIGLSIEVNAESDGDADA